MSEWYVRYLKNWVYPYFGYLKLFYAPIPRVGVGVQEGEKGGKCELEVTETGVNPGFSFH